MNRYNLDLDQMVSWESFGCRHFNAELQTMTRLEKLSVTTAVCCQYLPSNIRLLTCCELRPCDKWLACHLQPLSFSYYVGDLDLAQMPNLRRLLVTQVDAILNTEWHSELETLIVGRITNPKQPIRFNARLRHLSMHYAYAISSAPGLTHLTINNIDSNTYVVPDSVLYLTLHATPEQKIVLPARLKFLAMCPHSIYALAAQLESECLPDLRHIYLRNIQCHHVKMPAPRAVYSECMMSGDREYMDIHCDKPDKIKKYHDPTDAYLTVGDFLPARQIETVWI